jgi:iron-sulfur cluster repair protein YtfE (RIC family)
MVKLKTLLTEARELDPKAIKYMRQLTDRNNHTMARYHLALQMKNKKLMKLYSSIIDIQDAYGSLPMDVSKFRMSLEKELMSQAKKMYSNYDEISGAF